MINMGFLKDIAENAKNKQADEAKKVLSNILLSDETIDFFMVAKEDFVCCTNKRLIFLDRGAFSSKKVITAVRYSNIQFISFVKDAGAFTISKNVIISIGGRLVDIDFYSEKDANEVYIEISRRIF